MRKSKEVKAKMKTQAKARKLRGQAAELNAQARSLSREAGSGLSENAAELADRAADVADKIRRSDAYGKAWERGGELAAKGSSAALLARNRLSDSELADVIRDSETLAEARERSKVLKGTALAGLGTWLGSGSVGQQLGVQKRRRRWPGWLLACVGVGAGYALGVLTAPKRGEELRDDWAAASSSFKDQATKAEDRASQDTSDVSAPPAEKPLADKVRTVLGEDPRTSDLPKLNVNVVDGTVFVRGAVSSEVDTETIRVVIADVEGVDDVDLQLTTS